jgi:hypothetical protein
VRRALAATLVFLLVGAGAARAEPGQLGAAHRGGGSAAAGGAMGGAPPRLERLRAHAASSELRSELALREADVDASRRAERALSSAPRTRDDVLALRERALREEQTLDLETRVDLERLALRAGRPLGPVTRRVLERSGLGVDAVRRAADVASEARAGEAALRRSEALEPAF